MTSHFWKRRGAPAQEKSLEVQEAELLLDYYLATRQRFLRECTRARLHHAENPTEENRAYMMDCFGAVRNLDMDVHRASGDLSVARQRAAARTIMRFPLPFGFGLPARPFGY
jgi:hypothetical protein